MYLTNYINHIKSNLDVNVNVNVNVNDNDFVFIYNNKNPSYNDEIIKNLKLNAKNIVFIDNNYENIKYNLSVINKAKIIILLFDPSFYYNCIFLENKFIIIIDDYIYRPNGIGTHINSNPFLDYLFNIIANKNKIEIMKLADIYKFTK